MSLLKQAWCEARSGHSRAVKVNVLKGLRSQAIQRGEFTIGAAITGIVLVVVLGNVVVALWPTFVGTDTAVQALTGTDAGTTMLQAVWPIVLVVVGIAVAAGAILWAVKHFGLVGG